MLKPSLIQVSTTRLIPFLLFISPSYSRSTSLSPQVLHMASLITSCSVASPAAFAISSEASPAFSGLKPAGLALGNNSSLKSKAVSNGSRVNCMQVLNPYTNKKYETLSYLPPLTPDQIAKQVDYLISKGWIPCLEFDKEGAVERKNFQGSGYYDHRYWTMWKLPMFGCKDSAQVLSEIEECKNAYPECYVRVLGFDAKRQVQLIGFLVQKPVA